KGFIAASPGVQKTRGPHSISLLAHAKAGGAAAKAVVDYLTTIEGADDGPAVQPLSEAEAAALAGTYTLGPTPADRFEVTASKAQLSIGRPGHFARGLFHLGNFEFCPIGAESVRVAFTREAPAKLTVRDGELVLSANRVP